MKLEKSTVALVLGAVALMTAASGTAVAVTVSTVQIADPTSPSHVAHVDSSGRLSTSIDNSPAVRVAAPNQILNVGQQLQTSKWVTLVGPTTATLALTRIGYHNSASNLGNGTAYWDEYLYRMPVAGGVCGTIGTVVAINGTAPGADVQDNYDTAVVVKPGTDGSAYCLSAFLAPVRGPVQTPYTEPFAQLTGFLVAGSFTAPQSLATRQDQAQLVTK